MDYYKNLHEDKYAKILPEDQFFSWQNEFGNDRKNCPEERRSVHYYDSTPLARRFREFLIHHTPSDQHRKAELNISGEREIFWDRTVTFNDKISEDYNEANRRSPRNYFGTLSSSGNSYRKYGNKHKDYF